MCATHWAALRKAIADRGLDHLVAKSGEKAAERIKAELEGTATDTSYDPLMGAHNMIVSRSLQVGGLYMMALDESGNHRCPICEAMKHSRIGPNEGDFRDAAHVESHWIDGPADAALAYCREQKLIEVH
jgi:hypothetical protein